jgi:hypothetical protein
MYTEEPFHRPARHLVIEPRCDEQADISNAQSYIPCGAPTDGKLYKHKHSGEGPYHFCDRHLAHNLRRGFEEIPDAPDKRA